MKATVKMTLETEKVLKDIPPKWFGTQDYDSRRGDLIFRLGEELRLISRRDSVYLRTLYMSKDRMVWDMILKMPHKKADTARFICSMQNLGNRRFSYEEVKDTMGEGIADKLEKIIEIVIDVDQDYDGTYDGTETAAKARWTEA